MSVHTNLLCTAIRFQEFGDNGLLAVHKFSLLFEDYELIWRLSICTQRPLRNVRENECGLWW